MYSPCFECMNRYGRQYTEECDSICDYAYQLSKLKPHGGIDEAEVIDMYGLKVYITPQDIIDRLCDEDKARFNQCVFTDVTREGDGSITIDCIVFNDSDSYLKGDVHRQRYCDGKLSVHFPRLEPI